MNDSSLPPKNYSPVLLFGTGLVIAILLILWIIVDAEEHQHWLRAQGSLVAMMSIFWLVGWVWLRTRREPALLSTEAVTYDRAIRRLLWCVAIGYTALLLNANRWDHWRYGLVAKAMGYGTLVAGAAFISGLLLGFLFGFRPTSGAQATSDQSPNARQHPYTNLEEIADWLTKIILGAGLVELTSMKTPISRFAAFMARGVDPSPELQSVDPGSPAIALAIMGFFFASGVLYGYLWTRYEIALTSDKSSSDALALALVDRWLIQPATANDETRINMMNAIMGASLQTKLRIFLQAERYRKPSTEDTNARSLPIFQALVEADRQEVFHRNRAQCAFALMGETKDPKNPDDNWTTALNLLNKAIQIRDSLGEKDWQEYELARAVCQIHLDPDFKKGQSSNVSLRQSVLADLDRAKDISDTLLKDTDQDDAITAWRNLNP